MPTQSETLNTDMAVRALLDTREMDWQPSPSGKVMRKRLHLVGDAESGQVTSFVRYLPGSSFPEHDHPEGEEIFVVKGTFSDHRGDANEGMHLLNPEGYRHAPFSELGCLIFVKLRQYDGAGRPVRRTDTREMAWEASALAGIETKILFEDDRFPDVTRLERWAPNTNAGVREFPNGVEFFVIEGTFEDHERRYAAGSWLRLPAGSKQAARTDNGCVLYMKTGALPTLRSETG